MTKVKTITSLPEISVGIEINQSEFAPVHYFHTCPGYRVAKMIGGAVQVRNEMSKIMTQLRIDENIAKVIGQMLESQISGIPVVDALHRTLADILTASDGEETLADAEICKTISARLDAKGRIPDALINLKVHDGVVVFRGVIPKQHQRQMLCAIAESVPGVRTVHDHLIWIDRFSGTFMVSPEDSIAA